MRRPPRPSPPPPPTPAARRPKAAAAPRARLGTDERRAQLLGLGLDAFAARSYDEVSVDDIARAAGVSKGLLYHYFPTKRDFYRAAIGDVARRLLDETAPPEALPPAERLRLGLERYLAFAERHGLEYAALLRGGVGSDPDVGRVIEETRAAIVDRTLRGVRSGEPTPLLRTSVRGWVGFVEATSLEWAERRDVEPEALLQLWTELLFGLLMRLGVSPGEAAPVNA
ncbi:MAG TPA: TetR/AcrR family transcriptional regulator [Polyangiaceae bacterium]|nr:TetR/AcrR family transcriptional regulator [Polyangiaceae bacterium]